MREIKFRQAIFKDGKFHHWHYWGYVGYREEFVAPISIGQQGWNKTYEIKPDQQYTELKDKFKIRIYEGDILRFEKLPKLEVVEATDGGWNPFIDNMQTDSSWHYEVVGNIYEDKELLEEKVS